MLNAEGFLVRAAPTQEQLDLLYQQMTMLDQGAGVGLHQLRVFYAGIGWSIIRQRIDALVAAERLTRAHVGRSEVFNIVAVV